MTPDDPKARFDLVKKARQRHTLMAPGKASTDTQQGYEREFDRLVGQEREATDIWRAVCQTDKKRTYYRRVAAVRHGIRKWLGDYLRHQDACQRAGNWSAWQEDLKSIEALLDLDELVAAAAGHCPLAAPKRRTSKRQHLAKFPTDWRNQLGSRFRGNSYEAAFLVSALTGCRPHELETGINVTRTSDGVIFTVFGAKVKNTQGQKFRTLKYGDHPYVTRLLEILDIPEGTTVPVKVQSKVNWTSAIRRAGRALWPNARKDVTPYLLRHALASDLKRQGWDPDEISAVLGHCSAKTRSLYGTWSSGGSSPLGLKEVTAAKPVRSVEREQSFNIPTPKRGPKP